MKREEMDSFCAVNNIDCVAVGSEHELGEGLLLHWNNPRNPDDEECIHVKLDALEKFTPEHLRKVVVNGRDVQQVTRIVGYFSHVENWNKSKLGELKDRHRGDYQVQGAKA